MKNVLATKPHISMCILCAYYDSRSARVRSVRSRGKQSLQLHRANRLVVTKFALFRRHAAIMRRRFLFELNDDDGNTTTPTTTTTTTFANDERLPALPLPTLDDTLDRYYESLRPFGNADQLQRTRYVIDEFRTGIGPQLHALVEKRAERDRNWVERWWEDYAYCTDRTALLPACSMQGVLPDQLSGLQTMILDRNGFVRNVARMVHCSMAYWDLIRRERMRPATNPSGTITYSSFLLKRVFNTFRIPGERMDRIVSHFRTLSDQQSTDRQPSPVIVFIGKGRMFAMDILNGNGDIKTVQEIVPIIEQIVGQVEREEAAVDPVPILTCDNRTSWAQVMIWIIINEVT